MQNNDNVNTNNEVKGVATDMVTIDAGTDTNSGNKKSSVATNTEDFLNRIFHATDKNLFSYLWQRNEAEKTAGKTRAFPISDLSLMSKAVANLNQFPFGVSFSMGLSDKPVTKHAKTIEIVAIPCLWCDIDIQSAVHAEENLFESVGDIMTMFEKLKPLGLYPDMIIHSGYGVHAYWIFNSPILTQFTDEMLDPKSLLEKIQSIVRQLAKPFTVDKTDNLDRVLRIVGSKNWKDPSSVPTARIFHEKQHTYDAEEIAILIDDAITALNEQKYTSNVTSPISDENLRAAEKMRPRGISESLVSNGNFKLMIENCAFIRHVVENFNTTPEPILKDALTNLLRASNARDYVIQLCKKSFGAKFDEDLTNKRLAHYETQKPTTCKKIHETCNSCILDACRVFQLGKKVPAAIVTSNTVQTAIESLNKSLGDCVDDVPEDLTDFKIPPGYLIKDSGILFVSKQKFAMRSLCFISKIYYEFDSVDGRKTFYQMTARIDHRWNRFEVPAELVKESRSVATTLSKCGVKIDSNGAKYAVSFFNDFDSINEDSIPHVHRFSKTGWNNDKFIIPRKDSDFEVNAGTSTSYIRTNGSRDDSLSLVIESRKHNIIRTMIDSALSATIIRKINCNNFAVNFWGRSGFGKTASLHLVNSLFADPRYIIDFNATSNALETAFTERNDLPSFVNEFQLASSKVKSESGGDVIHRFESGESRKRLDRNSNSRSIKYFTGVLLITAEQPILNDSVEGGKIRRLLEVHFDKPIPPALCKRFYSESKQNFGHIGAEFIRLFESGTITFDFARSKRDEFQTLIKESNQDAIDSHLDYISVITLVDYLFQIHFENVDEKIATKNSLEFAEYLTQFAKSKSDLSDSERAKSFIIDWFNQHEMKFLSTNTDHVKIIREVFGYYLANSNIPLVNPSVLRKALLEGGFSPNKIFAEWHDDGVISYDESSKAYSQPFICNDGKRRRLTKLNFLNVDDPTPSNDDDPTPSNDDDSSSSNDDSNPAGGYSSDEDPFPKS